MKPQNLRWEEDSFFPGGLCSQLRAAVVKVTPANVQAAIDALPDGTPESSKPKSLQATVVDSATYVGDEDALDFAPGTYDDIGEIVLTFFEQFKNKRCFVTGGYEGEKMLWHYKPLFSSASNKSSGQSAAVCFSMKSRPSSRFVLVGLFLQNHQVFGKLQGRNDETIQSSGAGKNIETAQVGHDSLAHLAAFTSVFNYLKILILAV